MGYDQLVSAFIACGNTLDGLWNFFIGVHFAIIAAVYSMNREINTTERIVLTGIYVPFLLVNGNALLDCYGMYCALLNDIKSVYIDASNQNIGLYYKSLVVLYRKEMVCAIHSAAFVLVVSLFWKGLPFRKDLQKKITSL